MGTDIIAHNTEQHKHATPNNTHTRILHPSILFLLPIFPPPSPVALDENEIHERLTTLFTSLCVL